MLRWITIAALPLAAMSATAIADTRIQGAGASFPNPLYQRWVSEYQNAHPDIKIDYQSIGSGGGIKGITEKTIDFAGSDAPLRQSELAGLGEQKIVQFPSVAGGVVPIYNLPEVSRQINFTGDVLARIYTGEISNWNDRAIAELNPEVPLPDASITPTWRTDGSGTTYVFTHYLATQSAEFKSTVGAGKQVHFPLGQGGKGNEGVAAAVEQTPGAIGYVELNYARQNRIAYGAVRNKQGQFVSASPEAIAAAGANAAGQLKGSVLKADIWNQPGEKSYPIASFTYLIVHKDLNNLPDREHAQALLDFLWWASHEGQKMAGELDYAPLAAPVVKKVEDALSGVTYNGQAIKPSMQ